MESQSEAIGEEGGQEDVVSDGADAPVAPQTEVEQEDVVSDGADAPVAPQTEVELEQEKLATEVEITAIIEKSSEEEAKIQDEMQARVDELEDLRVHKLIADSRHRELKEHYGNVFVAMMGAEGVLEILRQTDLEALREQLLLEDALHIRAAAQEGHQAAAGRRGLPQKRQQARMDDSHLVAGITP